MNDRWTPSSWRTLPAKHVPDDYPDVAALARVGGGPAAPVLSDDTIAAAKDMTETDRSALAALMGTTNSSFQGSIFGVDIYPDAQDPDRYVTYLGQSGLGLPDRDYYLEGKFAAKKAAYQLYVARLLGLLGHKDPEGAAKAVVAFEAKLAKVSWTKSEQRDQDAVYNPMPYSGACAMEVELAIGLREAGYGVWQA